MEDEKIIEVEEETEVKESKFKNFASKVGAGLKKHGKTILMIGVAGAVGAAGYVLGSKRFANDDSEIIEGESVDVFDDSPENETEE